MHPFVKILTFIFVLLLISLLSQPMLFALCIIVCVVAMLQFRSFMRVMKRMRLFFLSIFIIYAFATPGEYIWQYPFSIAPSYEGVRLGLLQVVKLLISLASLSILFSTSSKENLMLGLYVLLSPLKYCGLSVERFTARLLLTFDYVEEIAITSKRQLLFHQLDDIGSDIDHRPVNRVIVLHALPYSMLDKLVMIGLIAGLLACFVLKVQS